MEVADDGVDGVVALNRPLPLRRDGDHATMDGGDALRGQLQGKPFD